MKIIVVGGGASGMCAAIIAARAGCEVTIIEGLSRIGKKLLSTGNGRCNLSNTDQSILHYHGLQSEEDTRSLVQKVFSVYDQEELLSFFRELGLLTRERGPYIYPASEQASSVLDCLRFGLSHEKIRVICDRIVQMIKPCKNGILVQTDQDSHTADRVIYTAGSKAGLKENSFDGYDVIRNCGHTLMGPLPALVQLKSDAKFFKPLAGIRVNAGIRLLDETDKILADEQGELQLNAYGFSGIPTLQVSYLASKYLADHQTVYAMLDLLPDMDDETCYHYLLQRGQCCLDRTAESFLIGMLHKNLGIALVKAAGIPLHTPVSGFTEETYRKLCLQIKHLRVPVLGTNGFTNAQVCAGGVNLKEVKETLESKLIPGLFLAGEILDVHGDCGGYNLQWAFLSGMLAGRNASGVISMTDNP